MTWPAGLRSAAVGSLYLSSFELPARRRLAGIADAEVLAD